jgi:hypothetical protein
MPLSVLEAQACGLPVITTKFGALPRFFKSSAAIQFSPEPARQLEIDQGSVGRAETEPLVPDWQEITLQLEHMYRKLLEQ